MSLDETLKQIRPLDRSVESAAQERLDSLTKPQGSLGKLEELARRIAVIQGKVPPRLGRKLLFVFAAASVGEISVIFFFASATKS